MRPRQEAQCAVLPAQFTPAAAPDVLHSPAACCRRTDGETWSHCSLLARGSLAWAPAARLLHAARSMTAHQQLVAVGKAEQATERPTLAGGRQAPAQEAAGRQPAAPSVPHLSSAAVCWTQRVCDKPLKASPMISSTCRLSEV